MADEATVDLVIKAQRGDTQAFDALFERAVPTLRRWARGRLPRWARQDGDTEDLVQDVLRAALVRLHDLPASHPGAFQAYLRQSVANTVHHRVRKSLRKPHESRPSDSLESELASPLEIAIGRERLAEYERALSSLRTADRELIVMRLELQYDYQTIATVTKRRTADAARVAVVRAVQRLMARMTVK
jgi:RNA polymerase sigma factor (sigma-70 family)